MKADFPFGRILRASTRTSATYWRRVVLAPEAASALSRFFTGSDRAVHLREVFVSTARDADAIERIALVRTGRMSAVRS